MVLYFSNSFSSSIRKDINFLFLFLSSSLPLSFLTYLLSLGNIKANGLILRNSFFPTSFEVTILSTLTSEIFIGLFAP